MAFLETGEISFSPAVDVKVNVCNTILSDKRLEIECHLCSHAVLQSYYFGGLR